MSTVDCLHSLRTWEVEQVAARITGGSRVLELGAGDGFQAAQLAARGVDVVAVDVTSSSDAARRLFPVREFDGVHLPFSDGCFDLVFSSNVLEHVEDLPGLLGEVARVLAPGGECLHVLPSAAWRLGQTLSHPIDLLRRALAEVRGLDGERTVTGRPGLPARLRRALVVLGSDWWPRRHGERGNAFTEVWSFSRFAWCRRLSKLGWEVAEVRPTGLWYTGHLVLGAHLPLRARHALAGVVGSATILYRVRKKSGLAGPGIPPGRP